MNSLTHTRTRTALVLTFLAATAATSVAIAEDYTLNWWTVDGGGVMRSRGGVYELSATVGQPDAGRYSGGAFTVTGGFWFEYRPGDCNYDGVVDLIDYADFAACMTGPDRGPVDPACVCFDMDVDDDVDLMDAQTFQTWFSG